MTTPFSSKIGRFTRTQIAALQTAVFIVFIMLSVLSVSETAVAQSAAPFANDLRISQVYGGGGNAGATYTHDFIEIFNSSSSTINLAGWSLQYASATGSSWTVTNLNGSIGAGQYYLVQQAQGAGGSTPLPTPDATGTIAMGSTAGKVALVNSTTALSGTCPTWTTVVDFIGFGTTANCYEGSGPTSAPSNTTAMLRSANGCIDTSNNSSDFAAGTPTPRNSSSLTNNCVTYNTISLDGTVANSEWKRGLLGAASGTTFGITWDDDFWYFSVKGGLSNTDFFMIGLDIDPENETSSNTGGMSARCGATFPTENKPDYILANRQNIYTRESWGWNGSGWDQGVFNPSETAEYDFSGGGGDYEVKLRKSSVFASNEDTSPVSFYLWLSNGSCEFFNAWPPENPNGYVAGSRFLYAHTRYATTDANRAPDTYGNRIAWAANTLSANSTTYNFFGEDDASTNPWLRMSTTTTGAGGASCTMRAKMVGRNAFNNPPFTGINRYIDFTLTNCTNLEVDVQMRYETGELNGVNEAASAFYRCPALPCVASWIPVSAGTHTPGVANNNLLLTAVPQTQFSFWTISDSNTPTAVSLQSFTSTANPTLPLLLATILVVLLLGGTLFIWQHRHR